MEEKSYLDKPIPGHTHKQKSLEIPEVYSGVLDFEFSHLIGKKGKAMIAVLLGTIAEFYDYALYGYMAAKLSERFFPDTDPSISFIKHFLVFALGFIARPLGSYIFGSIGDKYGRKYALRWNIIGIALPTVIIGCLPGYEKWGIFSVVLLCLCRIAQGMFISAESDGVDIFIYETMPKARACLANSLNWISGSLGVSLASFLAGLSLLPSLPDWAWRAPFLFAGVLGCFTLWFRKNLIESYDYIIYSNEKPTRASYSTNFLNAIKQNKSSIFLAIILQGSAGGVMCFCFTFWNNYLHKILDLQSASEACFKASLITLFSTALAPICAYIADRMEVTKAVKLAALLCMGIVGVNGIVLYYFNSAPSWLMALIAVSVVTYGIPTYVLLVKLFNIGERYRCRSISHAFGSMIFASTTPVVATYFWKYSQISVAPLFYCALLLLMGFVAACFVTIRPNTIDTTKENSNIDSNLENDSNLIGCPVMCCKKS